MDNTSLSVGARTNVSFVTANENPDDNYEEERSLEKQEKRSPFFSFFSRNIPKLIEIRQVKKPHTLLRPQTLFLKYKYLENKSKSTPAKVARGIEI